MSAKQSNSNVKNSLSRKQRKNQKRRVRGRTLNLESLEKRELLAGDGLKPIVLSYGVLKLYQTPTLAHETTLTETKAGVLVNTQAFDADGNPVLHGFEAVYANLRELHYYGGELQDRFTNNTSVITHVYGKGGNDILQGGPDMDHLYGDAGNDVLRGAGGRDYLHGGTGSDALYGDDGNDVIRGGTGNDTLLGGQGDDRLYGDAGQDFLDGETGKDYLDGKLEREAAISIEVPRITEPGPGESKTAVATVRISAPNPARDITLSYGTKDFGAKAGKDYTPQTGTIHIPASRFTSPHATVTAEIKITIFGDVNSEANKSFTIEISDPENRIPSKSAKVTILNQAVPTPSLRVPDLEVVEPAYNETAMATVRVQLVDPHPTQRAVLHYRTRAVTAKAGTDFTEVSGTIEFPSTNSLQAMGLPQSVDRYSKELEIPIHGDLRVENNETFLVEVYDPSHKIAGQTANVTIVNRAVPKPTISVSDIKVAEPLPGETAMASVDITLIDPHPTEATVVNYRTQSESARSGHDFTHVSGSITFPAASSLQTTQQHAASNPYTVRIQVPVLGDFQREHNETFSIEITDPFLKIEMQSARVTILNRNVPTPTLSFSDVHLVEPKPGETKYATLVVKLNNPYLARDIVLNYDTTSGDAVAGADFKRVSGTITFPATETSGGVSPDSYIREIQIPIDGDYEFEGDESFAINLTDPTNTVAAKSAKATISDAKLPFSFTKDAMVVSGTDGADHAILSSQSGNTFDLTLKSGSVVKRHSFTLGAVNILSGRPVNQVIFYGDDGDDRFDNSTNVSTVLYGGGGNDVLQGGGGYDTIHGDDGNDRMYGYDGNDVMRGGNGDDFVDGRSGDDQLFGDAGNDYVLGRAGIDLLQGGSGNDRLDGGDDGDVVDGNDGDDLMYGGNGNDTMNGGEGHDRMYGYDGNDVMRGGNGDDFVDGRNGDDQLFGDAGNDYLLGRAGNDRLLGGSGDDKLNGGDGHDLIWGQSGADRIFGGDGNDGIDAGNGNDYIHGGNGNDTIKGGSGDDVIEGGEGKNTLYGGVGHDRFRVIYANWRDNLLPDHDWLNGEWIDWLS